jgi:hypothetical protein
MDVNGFVDSVKSFMDVLDVGVGVRDIVDAEVDVGVDVDVGDCKDYVLVSLTVVSVVPVVFIGTI